MLGPFENLKADGYMLGAANFFDLFFSLDTMVAVHDEGRTLEITRVF